MHPVSHCLIALVPVVTYVVLRDQRPPSRSVLFATVVGSQFPDLVDKPLAYQLSVIPNGRMFAHSLLVVTTVSLVVLRLATHEHIDHRRAVRAFVFAYLTHVAGDFSGELLTPHRPFPSNLLWPFVPVASVSTPTWAGPGSIFVTLWSAFSLAVLTVTVFVVVQELRTPKPR